VNPTPSADEAAAIAAAIALCGARRRSERRIPVWALAGRVQRPYELLRAYACGRIEAAKLRG
jgi:hypothetical protein